jgi:hypothetical protein
MQIVLAKELVMGNSHSFSLSDLPIPTGEKFTVIVMRDSAPSIAQAVRKKVYAHRFVVDNIELPAREELYDR